MSSIVEGITKKIKHEGQGWVFTSRDFLDIGTRAMIAQALSNLAKLDTIRRLDRGIYDYPKQHKVLGVLSPEPYSIACALAAGDRVFPTGAMAANLLGLSTQVQAKPYYLTNATTLTRRVGNYYTIWLERAQISWLDHVPDQVNLTIQAIFYFGERGIEPYIIKRCARMLTDCDLADLRCATGQLPGWMADVIRRINEQKYENHHL